MQGPKAPKNPEKKRPYFYIMREKEIFSSRQEDGTGIQYIYESDGRLINSAQIAGNVTDKEELKLLETVEGFGKLVHSIGIFVETENPEEEIEFIFQIYGKKSVGILLFIWRLFPVLTSHYMKQLKSMAQEE